MSDGIRDGMERAGRSKTIADLIDPSSEHFETCSGCGGQFVMVLQRGDETLCRGCYEGRDDAEAKAAAVEELRARLPELVDQWLDRIGVSRRERTATLNDIPPALKARLKEVYALQLRAMAEGALPGIGLGIMGDAGTGKTFALSAILRMLAEHRVLAEIEAHGTLTRAYQFAAWVSWPEAAARLRVESLQEGGHKRAEKTIRTLCQMPLVVLDDLGNERVKAGASYNEDWATSQLDLIVDRRNREQLTTFWTSNLTKADFILRYGSRLFSRLLQDSVLIEGVSGRDLRRGA